MPYAYVETETGFALDFDALEASITGKTRLLILNDLQNPMGAESSVVEHEKLAELILRHDLYVLCDEAYFDMRYGGRSRSLVTQPGMLERCVILYTFSKKFAMTGWRLGASIGPKEIVDVIAKLNINDESCTTHFIQYGGLAGLGGDQTEVLAILDSLEERRDVIVDALNDIEGISCFRPNATFYVWPNVTQAMLNKGMDDYEVFRRAALHATGVSFCNRLHFGRQAPDETERYVRFAYSGIDVDGIAEGMALFKDFCES